MNAERWKQVDGLLQSALEVPPERRDEFLQGACAGDAELFEEIKSLLTAYQSAGNFLDTPAVHVAARAMALSEAQANTASLSGQIISHYRILRNLGSGGMGIVYEAEDLTLGRRVAIKFLPTELATSRNAFGRLQREARAASALDHPNICSIHEFGVHDRQPFIVMQLLEGKTLRAWIESAAQGNAQARLNQLIDFGVQIADGLQAAHEKGIIHRDIKPANIFITTRGDAKILDFGLAKVVDGQPVPNVQGASGIVDVNAGTADPGDMRLTRSRTATTAGTPCYMSPEQVLREQLDVRTDLFSLGLVLYEMVTGQRAFAGENWAAVQESILQRAPAPVRRMNPAVPAELERIINKALEKDRTLRYQCAQDVLGDLLHLREALAQVLSVRKRKLIQVAAALLFAMGTIASGLYYRGHQSKLLTNEDAIIVADLTNTTGEPVFDGTLRQALAVKLEESPFMNVVSDQKMNTMLGLTGHPPPTTVTPELAREICIRSGGRVIVTGSIARVGGAISLDASIRGVRNWRHDGRS
jgi:serine/threonine protein kinase